MDCARYLATPDTTRQQGVNCDAQQTLAESNRSHSNSWRTYVEQHTHSTTWKVWASNTWQQHVAAADMHWDKRLRHLAQNSTDGRQPAGMCDSITQHGVPPNPQVCTTHSSRGEAPQHGTDNRADPHDTMLTARVSRVDTAQCCSSAEATTPSRLARLF